MAIHVRTGNTNSVGPETVQVFDTSGSHTWTKPEGCILIKVQLVGAGGGAAGYWESGGAGGYSEKFIDVTEVESVSITVGAGGGYVGYYGSGGDGGTTTFGSYLYATGGFGGNRNHQHSGGRGGLGYGGDNSINFYGGGGSGHTNSAGSGAGGRGGASYFGAGAGDNRGSNHAKNGNGAPGSGGPGSRTDHGWGGQVGETGIVIIHEYYQR